MSYWVLLVVLVVAMTSKAFVFSTPLQIVFTDQPKHISIGSEVHLTCAVSGGSDPHTNWISATGLLPLNSHITNNGQTLVIMNFKAADNGQYICVTSDGQQFAHHKFTLHACNSGTHPFTIHPITLSTSTHPTTTYGWTNTHGPYLPQFRPIVVNPPNYQYGDDVNITCVVDYYPHPSDTLGWNFMVDVKHVPSNIDQVHGMNSVTLMIKCLSLENIGEYRCLALIGMTKHFILQPPN
ncbi:uncharacterized protein LOC111115009 [Crassostrea virginica]